MTIDPEGLKKTRTAAEGVLGEYRVTEARFHQAFDGLGIFPLPLPHDGSLRYV